MGRALLGQVPDGGQGKKGGSQQGRVIISGKKPKTAEEACEEETEQGRSQESDENHDGISLGEPCAC